MVRPRKNHFARESPSSTPNGSFPFFSAVLGRSASTFVLWPTQGTTIARDRQNNKIRMLRGFKGMISLQGNPNDRFYLLTAKSQKYRVYKSCREDDEYTQSHNTIQCEMVPHGPSGDDAKTCSHRQSRAHVRQGSASN